MVNDIRGYEQERGQAQRKELMHHASSAGLNRIRFYGSVDLCYNTNGYQNNRHVHISAELSAPRVNILRIYHESRHLTTKAPSLPSYAQTTSDTPWVFLLPKLGQVR